MKDIKIRDASPEDAEMIAEAIMEAVGDDIVDGMAGSHSREDVKGVFTRLARRDDSQYSYRNTRIAMTPEGDRAGVCISYDGGKLKELRRSFFEEAVKVFGWNITPQEVEDLPGETCGEEYYLDTLATVDRYRGRGIASALIADAKRKAERASLPLGLLVADHNDEARMLYERRGFRPVGRRPFAGEMMTNMRIPS